MRHLLPLVSEGIVTAFRSEMNHAAVFMPNILSFTVYMFTLAFINIYVFTHMSLTSIYMHATRTLIHFSETFIYTDIYMYTYIHRNVYVYIYMHTHAHTDIRYRYA